MLELPVSQLPPSELLPKYIPTEKVSILLKSLMFIHDEAKHHPNTDLQWVSKIIETTLDNFHEQQ